jgi:glyoxylase-like metal-dependent hydrolase (beta-lactamase superfamily II)
VSARVDHGVTSGTFSLDGETFDVDNNVWVVGDDEECVVIDAPHDVDGILAVVGDRRVKAILCTHAHDDHVRVAPALRQRVTAPILLVGSIRERLFALPDDTVVHTGHGDDTTVGAERAHVG